MWDVVDAKTWRVKFQFYFCHLTSHLPIRTSHLISPVLNCLNSKVRSYTSLCSALRVLYLFCASLNTAVTSDFLTLGKGKSQDVRSWLTWLETIDFLWFVGQSERDLMFCARYNKKRLRAPSAFANKFSAHLSSFQVAYSSTTWYTVMINYFRRKKDVNLFPCTVFLFSLILQA